MISIDRIQCAHIPTHGKIRKDWTLNRVGPRQLIEIMYECVKGRLCFALRTAILGPKKRKLHFRKRTGVTYAPTGCVALKCK